MDDDCGIDSPRSTPSTSGLRNIVRYSTDCKLVVRILRWSAWLTTDRMARRPTVLGPVHTS